MPKEPSEQPRVRHAKAVEPVVGISSVKKRMTLYFDGGSRGNPGISGAGFVLKDKKGVVVKKGFVFVGKHSTNNEAEYTGAEVGMQQAVAMGCTHLVVKGDSKLVVNQLGGKWKVKAENLKHFIPRCKAIVAKLQHVRFEHIERKLNSEADAMANEAMDRRGDNLDF